MLIRLFLLIGARSCPAETFMVNIRPRYHLQCPLFVLYFCPTFTQISVVLYLKSFCGFFFNLPLLSFVSLCLCFFFSCFDAIVFVVVVVDAKLWYGPKETGGNVSCLVLVSSRLNPFSAILHAMYRCKKQTNKLSNLRTTQTKKHFFEYL